MHCSNCGKDIPFGGNVCPWCHADKSGDQQRQILLYFFGMVGAALGWLIHGIGAALIGIFVGMIVGLIANKKIRS